MFETEDQVFYELLELDPDSAEYKKAHARLIQHLHCKIYEYPIRRFHLDRDTSSDFYVYMLDKIDDLIWSYDADHGVSFATFLSYQLKRLFFKFMRAKKRTDFLERYEIELPREQLVSVRDEIESPTTHWRKRVVPAIQHLSTPDQVSIRLYYGFPLMISQFRFLLRKHQTMEVFAMYREYLSILQTWKDSAEKRLRKFNERYQKVMIEAELARGDSPEKQEAAEKNIARLMRSMRVTKPPITYKMISAFLKESLSSVYRRIRKNLKEIRAYLLKLDTEGASL